MWTEPTAVNDVTPAVIRWNSLMSKVVSLMVSMSQVSMDLARMSVRPTLRSSLLVLYPGVPGFCRGIVNACLNTAKPSAAPHISPTNCCHQNPDTGETSLKRYGGSWGTAQSCHRCKLRWKARTDPRTKEVVWEIWPYPDKKGKASASGALAQSLQSPQHSLAMTQSERSPTSAASSVPHVVPRANRRVRPSRGGNPQADQPSRLARTLGPGEAHMLEEESDEGFEVA